ncbi:hypothetical protein DFA_05947 [Cavenderia fasciculata]|uniref:Uncharacterized protein n=1 Tax=Cavenderia fasciculata TaxID=261658 RepID=F4PJN7_CACFS|nr:uncharacterized protein DFA_05947 [Cavenderia fasciculata]EGG23811.1 hypothetical protein DFA_05947 [Cavenderia fasciculata]|eukprot:XP_004361662.1 hypothetical protein DFA_05947 [Cavenderia fasciculata]
MYNLSTKDEFDARESKKFQCRIEALTMTQASAKTMRCVKITDRCYWWLAVLTPI